MKNKAGPKGYSKNTNPFGFGKGVMPEGHPSRKIKKPKMPKEISIRTYMDATAGPKKQKRRPFYANMPKEMSPAKAYNKGGYVITGRK